MTQEICFADVSFGYTAADLTLERISLTIKSGQYVAVVGPSGSGKSTLLSLLLRFYDPTSGLVTVDGYDLRRVTQESLRAQMAVVFQDTFLFNTTIRGNIGLGRPEVTDEAIEAAARAAEIHETILGWPRGYDTPVGEMGGLLSGGQRQRIAIARAIVCNPAILLLDEPVTGLDPPAEAAIRRTLRRIARGRTIIEVTHRLIAMEHLDQIFVLQGGCLVEQGRHHELLRHRGLYYRLWLQQQSVQSHRDGDEALVGTAVRSNHQDTRQEQGIQPGWDDEQASNGTAVRSAHAWSGLPQPLAGPWIAPSLATDSHHNAVDARHRLRIGDPGGRILAPSPGRRALRLYFMLAFKRGMPQPNPVMVELLEILRGWGIEVETGIAEEVVLRPASFGCQHDLYILKSHADLWLSMAGILHAQGAHILNPYLACLASHNKISADQSLKAADIPIPNSWLTGDLSRLRALTEERALVIKPHTGGRGRDVFVVQNGRDLAAVPEPRQPLLVQEYVPGNELKVYVIGDAVFGIRKIVEDGEARRVVAPISHAVHSIALQCGEVFGLGLYGLDVIEGPDGPVVIDVNYFPSYKGVPGAASLLSEYIVDYATLRSSKPRLQLRLLVPGPAAPMADVVAPEEPAPDAAPDPPLEETLPAEETSPAASAEPIVPPRAASVSGAALASRFAALWSLTGGAIAAVLVAFLIFSLIGLPNAGSSTRPKTTTVTAESAASPVPGATPAPTPPPAASPAASPVQAAVTQPPPPPPPSARPVTGSAAPVSASVAEPPPFDESGDGRGEPPPPPSERQIRQAEQEFLRDFFNNHP
jgi:ABC-type multidrug transport system ATPase subunit